MAKGVTTRSPFLQEQIFHFYTLQALHGPSLEWHLCLSQGVTNANPNLCTYGLCHTAWHPRDMAQVSPINKDEPGAAGSIFPPHICSKAVFTVAVYCSCYNGTESLASNAQKIIWEFFI